LSLHHDGRVRLAFKAPWKDGTHAVLLDPLDLIARLAALVPPPRFHMIRYHGVLAAHAAVRAEVVPGREPQSPPPQLPLFEASDAPLEPPPPSRHPWPWLLRRVFAVEVSVCPLEGCSGRMRVVEIASKPDDVARVPEEQSPERRAPRTRAPPPLTASLAQLGFACSRAPRRARRCTAPSEPRRDRASGRERRLTPALSPRREGSRPRFHAPVLLSPPVPDTISAGRMSYAPSSSPSAG